MPALDEQRRIADFLDDRVARIEQIIAARQQQVELAELGRLANLDAVVRGSAPTQRISRVVALGAVGVVVNPSTYFEDEGVPFVHGYNVRDGYLDLTEVKHMSQTSSNALSRSQLRAGDVLVVRAGFPGRAAVVPPELAGGNCASVLLLRPGDDLQPEWLAAFFNSPLGKQDVDSVQYGAAQGVINLSDVMSFELPLPPLDDQRKALAAYERTDNAWRQGQACAERQISVLQEYKQSLITAAVTGEFDVTSAAPIPE
ncbi:hypothetical protein CGZ93_07310 [Enemella dayhoffiae]|uniref:Type I restriction modification DNA specificity domain-containing protein n=1 Tax=Enemella dayhoffiae TaxID=2016507 RepID=A0A255H647_9ACTN|nr:hypothetical protein [Enemella dayhoffiae]OYO22653.1 hypothetical protein CGZ93_07310 [Enemella dayhoffiae]